MLPQCSCLRLGRQVHLLPIQGLRKSWSSLVCYVLAYSTYHRVLFRKLPESMEDLFTIYCGYIG